MFLDNKTSSGHLRDARFAYLYNHHLLSWSNDVERAKELVLFRLGP
jgi:hypothetical protein